MDDKAQKMVRSVSINTTSPHDVIEFIFENKKKNYILIKKTNEDFTDLRRDEGKIRTYASQIFHAIKSVIEIYRNPKCDYIAREFDGFSLFYLISPIGTNLMLNVNHNLCTWHGRLVTRVLSFRFQIAFIDPGPETLEKFKYILPIHSNQLFLLNHNTKWDGVSVLLICGSKKDQLNYSQTDLMWLSSALSSAGYKVIAVGKNYPNGIHIPISEFIELLSRSIVICTAAYKQYRNSGTLWFIKRNAPIIFCNKSDCATVQLEGHPKFSLFDNLSEVISLVTEVSREIENTQKSKLTPKGYS